MWFARVLTLLAFVTLLGCGPQETTTSVQEPTANAQIKSGLEYVSQTGEIDSGLQLVQEELEKLKATDAAKADELLADLDALMKLNGDAAKEKATEMLGKL